MNIVLATSGCAPERLVEIEDDLRALGHTALLPYTVSQRDTWTGGTLDRGECDDDESETHRDHTAKREAYERQCQQIETSDALLVVNDEKHGERDYFGARLLMEITVARAFEKPIFVLNDNPTSSPYAQEVALLNPMYLHGNLEKMQKHLAARAPEQSTGTQA